MATGKTGLAAGRPSERRKAALMEAVSDTRGPQVRINFDIDADDQQWLKIHAVKHRTTVADLMRAAIKAMRERAGE